MIKRVVCSRSTTTLNNLWILHCVYGQHSQAEPLQTRALAIKEELLGLRERALGPSHPEVEKMPEGLANVLRKLGRADEAISLELRAKNFRAKRS